MKPIVCDGLWSEDNNQYLVSMSQIWSHLIRECGRLVDEYNSDILVDINSIQEFIKGRSPDSSKIFWIGLRECGVDSESFIKCRVSCDYYYRAIYRVVVEKTMEKCKVTLEKSGVSDFLRYLSECKND